MNELQALQEQLTRIEEKVDAAYRSAEKTRKYFLWTLIITLLSIVIPLIGLFIFIPYYISTLQLTDFVNIGGMNF